jgi:protein OS-9
MTMTDNILFVKEAKTCSYVLVIHTPRLCSEPGFKSRLEFREEALIRCRQIVHSTANQHSDIAQLPESDHPYKLPRLKQKPILSSPEIKEEGNGDRAGRYDELIRKALEALVGSNSKGIKQDRIIVEQLDDNGEVFIEFMDEAEAFGDGDGGIDNSAIAEALRAAGFDIKEKTKEEKKAGKREENQQHNHADNGHVHEEL